MDKSVFISERISNLTLSYQIERYKDYIMFNRVVNFKDIREKEDPQKEYNILPVKNSSQGSFLTERVEL
ncbi:MAG: hypothetical protein XD76_0258 [candidate division TA06 bacterium 32_111]|uniref:Uncharacterized protein n=2 Tax=Bacteria candidate phyla TaxID=1783234 RepID=A0A101I3B5_UNCT6|nr:MAG: hypothetical protein XD76_0258 [candidate division TA06 bacterium 32_111]KUK87709.1 MAG: hypothetical protein XE03_0600 [candidate division TA06 bacterium 34_109]HAF07547.1 hypothetical protein [candidate division WOR-3 bacterium]HCP17616.1 hypothetical protein [candidate division WOR-3 bacterium]